MNPRIYLLKLSDDEIAKIYEALLASGEKELALNLLRQAGRRGQMEVNHGSQDPDPKPRRTLAPVPMPEML